MCLNAGKAHLCSQLMASKAKKNQLDFSYALTPLKFSLTAVLPVDIIL